MIKTIQIWYINEIINMDHKWLKQVRRRKTVLIIKCIDCMHQ